ncbi:MULTISPECIES: MFS transporter [unclassified Duganella]|uniref:MFS transporter n=1 Tax=unclassified Duganella TaxID=2636909 RepID=UPI00088360E5|nr:MULTISPECIES: MFS transporter [unclassified Duganella]SDH16862.1 MFS transporter, DHA1 family, arabinose polymer transporter [Duganella sp. OV458]SDK31426.1 MFS transporter, DHA1 family, inner membrane transport protein [Duganella sp. OV510]
MNKSTHSSALPLLALAIGAFGIGTTEFGPMGMLLTIAQGVNVSIPTAGLLVSAYAIGVTIGAPFMTLLLARWPRRKALIALMAIFTIGNILSALAPGYASLMVARVITSLTHGAFFGIGSVVAASLVPRDKQASAVATMFLGLTIANIGGVPAATWLSDSLGWRESFGAISALGVLAMAALLLFLPQGSAGEAPDVRKELKVLLRPVVLQGLMTTVLASGATFALYTYINPSLKTFTQASPGFITAMLALIGIGFTIGNSLGGKLADKSIDKTLIGFLLLEAVTMVAFPWLAQTQIGAAAGLLVWGIAAFALVPPVQMRVMRAATEAPGLASSVNIGAFNLGNAIGAAAGAMVLNANLGYAAVMYAGAVLTLLALALVAWSAMTQKSPQAAGAASGL